jgi:hypothetical protein
MLAMKQRKTMLPDSEKKQGWKCSRCGTYLEKQQVFLHGLNQQSLRKDDDDDDDIPYLRRRP